MKSVAIIELNENHYDFIISIISFIKKYNNNYKIVLFINEKTYNFLKVELDTNYKDLEINKVVKLEENSLEGKLSTIKNHNCDITIFNTIPLGIKSLFQYLKFSVQYKGKIIIGIHNINSWFNLTSKCNIKHNISYILRKLLLSRINGVIVLNTRLSEYFKSKSKIINIVIPFKLSVKDSLNIKNSAKSKVCFVIPGTVDIQRRDYISILEVFMQLSKETDNIELKLLGKVISNEVVDFINKNKLNSKIRIYNQFIDQTTFNTEMIQSDFILAPIQNEFNNNLAVEYYGHTKASGAEFDSIKYVKPLIINDFYKVGDYQKDYTYYFKDWSHLTEILRTIINDLDQSSGFKMANDNRFYHEIDKQLESQFHILDKIIK